MFERDHLAQSGLATRVIQLDESRVHDMKDAVQTRLMMSPEMPPSRSGSHTAGFYSENMRRSSATLRMSTAGVLSRVLLIVLMIAFVFHAT
jgi:hypothetical protein